MYGLNTRVKNWIKGNTKQNPALWCLQDKHFKLKRFSRFENSMIKKKKKLKPTK